MSYIDAYKAARDIAAFFDNDWIKVTISRVKDEPSKIILNFSTFDDEGEQTPTDANMSDYAYFALSSMTKEINQRAARLAEKDAKEFAIRAKEEAEEILQILSENKNATSAAN